MKRPMYGLFIHHKFDSKIIFSQTQKNVNILERKISHKLVINAVLNSKV